MITGAKTGAKAGLTRHFKAFQVSRSPPVFVIDSPGILQPKIETIEDGLKLALTGRVVWSTNVSQYGFNLWACTQVPLEKRRCLMMQWLNCYCIIIIVLTQNSFLRDWPFLKATSLRTHMRYACLISNFRVVYYVRIWFDAAIRSSRK